MTQSPPPKPATYEIQAGDTYPSIAEQFGHAGEWQELVNANPPPPPSDLPIAWLEPGALVAGVVIQVPADWAAAPAQTPAAEAPGSRARPRQA